MKTVNEPVFNLQPNTFDVKGPDGVTYTLRERNGHDESILSRMEDLLNRSNTSKFLSSVLVSPTLTAIQVQQLPIRVKNYLLLEERIHEFGKEITWTHKFTDDASEVDFDENLEIFLGKCHPYPEGKQMTGKLASGKSYKMDFLTGEAEMKVGLEKNQNDLDVNDRFRVRNLHIQDGNGAWHKIERFDVLSAKETKELRKIVEEQDPEFNMVVTLTNPKTQAQDVISFLMVNSFFFP